MPKRLRVSETGKGQEEILISGPDTAHCPIRGDEALKSALWTRFGGFCFALRLSSSVMLNQSATGPL